VKLCALLPLHSIDKHVERGLDIGEAINERCLDLWVLTGFSAQPCDECHLPATVSVKVITYKKLMQS